MNPPLTKGSSHWRDRFRFDQVKVLVVCRGPIRLEALQAFENLGAQPGGILLSEKDSVVYRRALAPELRLVGRNERVHRIPDYGGASGEEKAARIAEIIGIAREAGYTHIFAGYGFMAEDDEFIRAIEKSGLGFVGPCSGVAERAGSKDAAKALARELGVSVTPGLDNIVALTLLAGVARDKQAAHLARLVAKHKLKPESGWKELPPEEAAERVLSAAQAMGVELVSLARLQAETRERTRKLFKENPGQRLRLKHVGGGGGKGQRILSQPDQAADAVFEVLSESKALDPGANRNFLIELNVEDTRHNEIQLLGNGKWCISLGGRDCSLQMHEQKLLEVSITPEMLREAATARREAGQTTQPKVLERDAEALEEMERQAERFGEAVGLDSASTFESIVSGDHHYFMEMNTRIQVEHRVTEMVYALRFANPEDPGEWFQVESLVEAMLWVAVHGRELPRPERIPRHGSGAEVRINSTNDALRPHAGGVILDWTEPIEHEVRDDQGIGMRNPDTGTFMPYNLAGAYDSNAALVVSYGRDREENFLRLAEILRRMEIRGDDVMTNKHFHLGLLHWMLGADPMVKPSTRFVQSYLAAVGALATVSRDLDLDAAWEEMTARTAGQGSAGAAALARKVTLILRPLRHLYAQPHMMAGWLAARRPRRWVVEDGRFHWRMNPLEVLNQLYQYLRWEEHTGVSPEEQIWRPDRELLSTGLEFYAELNGRMGGACEDWESLEGRLAQENPPQGFSAKLWGQVRSAHRGHRLGLDLLKLPIITGEEAGFYGLHVNQRLEPVMPKAFLDSGWMEEGQMALAPPPPAQGNEILAWTGGTFFGRPSPDQPLYVSVGEHFDEGQVVGLLEVMKMFNPIRAEFPGTIKEVLVSGEAGVIVAKGQPLFEVEPDYPLIEESEEELATRRQQKTSALMALL